MEVWLTNMQACLIDVDKCMVNLNAGLSGCQGNSCDGAWYLVLTRQQTTKYAAVGVALVV